MRLTITCTITNALWRAHNHTRSVHTKINNYTAVSSGRCRHHRSNNVPGSVRHLTVNSASTRTTPSSSSAGTSSSSSPPSSVRRPIYLCLLGAPGVGKGTYASRLSPYYDVPTVSTGELIRAEIKADSPIGRHCSAITSSGGLVEDDLVYNLLQRRLSQSDCIANGYLLDGYPRRLSQARQLAQHFPLDLVVNLELRQDILLHKITSRRVCSRCGRNYNLADINDGEYVMPPLLPTRAGICDTCGSDQLLQRVDDAPDTVTHRLHVYKEQTLPLVQFYTAIGKLITFQVKKGIADMPQLIHVIEEALHARRTTAEEENTRLTTPIDATPYAVASILETK